MADQALFQKNHITAIAAVGDRGSRCPSQKDHNFLWASCFGKNSLMAFKIYINISKNFRSTTSGRVVHSESVRKYGLRELVMSTIYIHFPFLKYLKSICHLHMGATCKPLQLAPGLSTATNPTTNLTAWNLNLGSFFERGSASHYSQT